MEAYAARVLRELPDTSAAKAGDVVRVTGVDYKRFKLFQLSLLWRAGVARQPSFAGVELGRHEAKLRGMLLSGQPGEPMDYPCLLIHTQGSESLEQIMKMPGRNRFLGHRIYHMVLGGMISGFFVSNHTASIRQTGSFLSVQGVLPIHIGSETAKDFLAGVADNLRKAGVW